MPPEVLAREAARRKLAFGLQAGLIATLLMTGLLVAAPLLAGWRTSQAAAQTIAQLRAHPLIALAALAAHLTYGAAAGALFTVGARAINVTRGALYGLGLWGVAAAIYAPLVGLGFVASHQPALAAVALPLHVAYGVALGAFAPRGEIVQPLDAAASA
ncbi:MAG TPA: hypothetical protein VFF06_19075 [Polyangia bacterium]|nr:hypothetical protein [Polyangia bacterium]